MQEEEKGISLSDIFRAIAVKKWLALIIAAVITLVGTISVYFGLNKLKNNYVARFSISLPGNNTGTNYVYPDGTLFNYIKLVQYSNLERVKTLDEKFKDIDVGGMVDSGDISISRTSDNIGANDYVYYTLSVKAKYFKDYSQARLFMVAVAQTPKSYFSEISIDYGIFLNQADASEDYEDEIDFLESQLTYLQNEYAALIGSLGGNFVVNGRTLSSYAADVSSYKNRGSLDILLERLRDAKVIKSDASKNNLDFKSKSLKNQLDAAVMTLDALVESNADVSGGKAEVVKAQSDLVEKLRRKWNALENIYKNEGKVDNNAFGEEYIHPEYVKIAQLTDDYKQVAAEANTNSTAVSFMIVNAVSVEDGYSLAKTVVVCLLAGIIVALIVAYIVGSIQMKKKSLTVSKDAENKEPEGVEAN